MRDVEVLLSCSPLSNCLLPELALKDVIGGTRRLHGSPGVGRPVAMPSIQGLSKKAANYRPAQTPSARCQECKYMWPKLSVGGCRYVRGVIHADDVCNEFAPERPRP